MAQTVVAKPITGKRKRDTPSLSPSVTTLHITVGSYERVLHGFTAAIDSGADKSKHLGHSNEPVSFTDAFLLNAHTSSIRCLGLSPPSSHRRTLATGGTDERINLYQLSTIAPLPPQKDPPLSTKRPKQSLLPTPLATPTTPAILFNRTLGSLGHHASTITTLSFPTPSKLLTASLDNTVSILRARDWTPLTTLKAPIPKLAGRPSGDTVGPGEVPAGVTDFAVHPSLRLGISVGVGERCMRLWNLVNGKRAGVLMFDKAWLAAAGEGSASGEKTSTRLGLRGGEAKRVVWREDGEEFAVGFERGVLVYGLDCVVRGALRLSGRDKISQIRYLPNSTSAKPSQVVDGATNKNGSVPASSPDHPGPSSQAQSILAVSTESGNVLFYDTESVRGSDSPASTASTTSSASSPKAACKLSAKLTATSPSQPAPASPRSRIKDFVILPATTTSSVSVDDATIRTYPATTHYIITALSSGGVNVYSLDVGTLPTNKAVVDTKPTNATNAETIPVTNGNTTAAASTATAQDDPKKSVPEVGTHLSIYETDRRITCLAAFIMEPSVSDFNPKQHPQPASQSSPLPPSPGITNAHTHPPIFLTNTDPILPIPIATYPEGPVNPKNTEPKESGSSEAELAEPELEEGDMGEYPSPGEEAERDQLSEGGVEEVNSDGTTTSDKKRYWAEAGGDSVAVGGAVEDAAAKSAAAGTGGDEDGEDFDGFDD